jgi:hypothetical protein
MISSFKQRGLKADKGIEGTGGKRLSPLTRNDMIRPGRAEPTAFFSNRMPWGRKTHPPGLGVDDWKKAGRPGMIVRE